ncbi:MAG: NIPSNAP family protein [Proteobacteria bacterium]|nr:NIPSNAP family protein [Pseudomonadota bacterium]
MLIEYRAYTLRLGAEALFWEAQKERGPDGLRPILDRLIGSFATRSGPNDEIASLYRYDDFGDWQSRLMGLYGQAGLQPYFRVVRPLIARQQSSFLVPAPVAALTPHWGNGHDWLPAQGPLLRARAAGGIVEETRLNFSAGGVPACWEAFRQHALGEDPAVTDGLLGAFNTIAGSLNQVLLLRQFDGIAALEAHRGALRRHAAWTSFLRTLAPLTVSSDVRLLQPAPVPDMSPMFSGG